MKKNLLIKGLCLLDLWVVLVASTVFISLYFIHGTLLLNEILIVLTSVVSFNMVCVILLNFNYPKQIHALRKQDTEIY